MALVYNSIEIPYAARVTKTLLVPLYPRIRQSIRLDYNIRVRFVKSFPIVYDIIDYIPVAQSIEASYSGRVTKSIEAPYSGEFRVLQSIARSYSGAVRVTQSAIMGANIPGYTLVTKSTRVLMRYNDFTLIQPSVGIRVTLL